MPGISLIVTLNFLKYI